MRRVLILTAVIGVLSGLDGLRGQEPRFEVASVKPNKSDGGSISVDYGSPNGFVATNISLGTLIMNAYQLNDFQLLQAPSWLNADRFDVTAKAAGEMTPAQKQLALRALLADRFKFAAHTETRELPGYVLVLARPDGVLGPGLRRSSLDCAAPPASCGTGVGQPGLLRAKAFTIRFVVGNLSSELRRVVVDKTALTGLFDIDLEWARNDADTTRPSIFTAVQEQLGLRLESARAPTEVLVIDHVEQPTPD